MKRNRLADRISRMSVSDTGKTSEIIADENRQDDEIIIIEDENPIQNEAANKMSTEKIKGQKQKRTASEPNSLRNHDRNLSIFKTGSFPYRVLRRITGILRSILAAFKKISCFFTARRSILLIFTLLILIIGINRLPSFIYNLRSHEPVPPSYSFYINEKYVNAINDAVEKYNDEDFDGDGIKNADDSASFDIDMDNNGVIDTDTSNFSFSGNFRIGDITYEPVSHESGVTQILDVYEVNGCKDQWVKVSKTGYPYIFSDNRWTEAEYTEKDGNIYVLIPYDYCYLRILDKKAEQVNVLYLFNSEFHYSSDNIGGKLLNGLLTVFYPYKSECPYDIGCRDVIYDDLNESSDIISSNRVTRINENNLYRFAKMPLDADDLIRIYTQLQVKKTSVLSLQSDRGEILLIVYGCDNMGNLYAADYTDPTNKGKLDIIPKTTLVKNGEYYMTKTTVEIKGYEGWKAVLVD